MDDGIWKAKFDALHGFIKAAAIDSLKDHAKRRATEASMELKLIWCCDIAANLIHENDVLDVEKLRALVIEELNKPRTIYLYLENM